MPFTPRIGGRMIIPMMTKINVLMVEIKTDIFPFEKAVNIAEAKILTPIVKKLIEKRLNPLSVIW